MRTPRTVARAAALLAVALAALSAAGHAGASGQPIPSRAPSRQTQPAAIAQAYLPLLRTAPPLPSRLVASADADLLQGLPTSNFGSASSMWLGYHKSGCTDDPITGRASRDLIQFDLSAVPTGAAISRAVLNVRLVGQCWNTRASAIVTAYRVAAPWQELAATWNSQPAAAEAAGAVAIPFNFGANTWYAIDITGLVRGWVNQTTPNYGLMLRAPEGAGNDFAFIALATRSWIGYEPYLQLTYGGAALDAAAPLVAPPLDCEPGRDLTRCAEPLPGEE